MHFHLLIPRGFIIRTLSHKTSWCLAWVSLSWLTSESQRRLFRPRLARAVRRFRQALILELRSSCRPSRPGAKAWTSKRISSRRAYLVISYSQDNIHSIIHLRYIEYLT